LKNRDEGLAEGRANDALDGGCNGHDATIEEFDLARGLSFEAQDVRIDPPAEEPDEIGVMHFSDEQSRVAREAADHGAIVAAVVVEIFVDGTVQGVECGQLQNDNAAGR
jgi:hypothetical protein